MSFHVLYQNTETLFKQAMFVVQRFIIEILCVSLLLCGHFDVGSSCIVSPHGAYLHHLSQLPMHSMSSHRHLHSSISCRSAQVSGWELSLTMSPMSSSRLQLSPVACLGTASFPQLLGIKAHQFPARQLRNETLRTASRFRRHS